MKSNGLITLIFNSTTSRKVFKCPIWVMYIWKYIFLYLCECMFNIYILSVEYVCIHSSYLFPCVYFLINWSFKWFSFYLCYILDWFLVLPLNQFILLLLSQLRVYSVYRVLKTFVKFLISLEWSSSLIFLLYKRLLWSS